MNVCVWVQVIRPILSNFLGDTASTAENFNHGVADYIFSSCRRSLWYVLFSNKKWCRQLLSQLYTSHLFFPCTVIIIWNITLFSIICSLVARKRSPIKIGALLMNVEESRTHNFCTECIKLIACSIFHIRVHTHPHLICSINGRFSSTDKPMHPANQDLYKKMSNVKWDIEKSRVERGKRK